MTCEDGNTCATCPDGKFFHEDNCLNKCPDSFYANNGICLECLDGCATCADGVSCLSCTADNLYEG